MDIAGIKPTFSRALPKNLLEISQITANLWGKVSRKTLLSQIPFVEDVDNELETLDKEAEENLKRQQEAFSNFPPDIQRPQEEPPEKEEVSEE